MLRISTDITREHIDIDCGYVEFAVVEIVDHQKLVFSAVDFQPLQAPESTDAVFKVNDGVPVMELRNRANNRFGILSLASFSAMHPFTVELGFHDDLNKRLGRDEPSIKVRGDDGEGVARRIKKRFPAVDRRRVKIVSGQKLR